MTSTLEQLKQDVAARRKQVADSARVQRQIDQERSLADLHANIQHILTQTHLDPNWLRNAPPLQTRTALYNAGIRIYVRQNHITRITISPD